jgi:hypothetical protein
VSTTFRRARSGLYVPRTSYDSLITALAPAGRWKLDDANGQSTAVATVGTNGTGNAARFGAAGLVTDGGTAWSNSPVAAASLTLPLGTRGAAGSLLFWYAYISGGGAGVPLWRDNTASAGWFIEITGTNPVVRINGTSHTVTTVTASTLRTGSKNEFALTTTGGTGATVTFYIDGSQADQWTQTGSWSGLNTSLIFGVNGSSGSQICGGTWDDVATWNSVLTPTNVSDLWNAGK